MLISVFSSQFLQAFTENACENWKLVVRHARFCSIFAYTNDFHYFPIYQRRIGLWSPGNRRWHTEDTKGIKQSEVSPKGQHTLGSVVSEHVCELYDANQSQNILPFGNFQTAYQCTLGKFQLELSALLCSFSHNAAASSDSSTFPSGPLNWAYW